MIRRDCFRLKVAPLATPYLELDRLCGTLEGSVVDEILEHEYPTIMKAHESLSDQFASLGNPRMRNRAEPHQSEREAIDEWSNDLRRRLRQAIDSELQRSSEGIGAKKGAG